MRKSISQLNMLSPEEYDKIVRDFNNTAVDYPRDKCVHTLFEEQVAKTPDKTAVIACDKTLTYKELNEQANRIAYSLIEKGVKPNDIIAFMLPRRSYLLSTMFGTLKSGAAYMPIDPDYPQDRINYMLSDSGAKFCITEDNVDELLSNENTENPCVQMTSDNLCYCIYTSGSTGNPKGTVITHKSVINFCTPKAQNHFTKKLIDNCEVILSTNSISFDIVLQEIHLPLLNGLGVLLFNSNGTFSETDISNLTKFQKLGLITTPVKITMFLQNPEFCRILKNFSIIMIGADILNRSLIEKISHFTKAKIINGYGPTETTCGVTYTKNIAVPTTPPKKSAHISRILMLSQIKI